MSNTPKGHTFFPSRNEHGPPEAPTLHMLKGTLIAIGALYCSATSAIADPQGVYYVQGTEVDGTTFEGTVSVLRTGETYKVRWTIDGITYRGSGLGASPSEDRAVIGPATSDDDVLIVGYASLADGFGISIYTKQSDGSWDGIWTEYGSSHVATETWTPIEPAKRNQALPTRQTSQQLPTK